MSMLMLGASLASAQAPVAMKNVEIRATLRPDNREVDATIRVAVATPIGRIPVSGRGQLHYDCEGLFSGTMSYNPVVRFFARLKGVALVTAMDGRFITAKPIDCTASAPRAMNGRADVDSTLMRGWITIDSDTVPFRGPAWTHGDSTYHTVLSAERANRPLTLHMNMYKHPRMMQSRRK
jgi:hypothetical protein